MNSYARNYILTDGLRDKVYICEKGGIDVVVGRESEPVHGHDRESHQGVQAVLVHTSVNENVVRLLDDIRVSFI